MSVIAVCGLPGSGKSLFTTYLARKQYKALNRFNFGYKKNYVYSNYPIKLDNKHFSKQVNLKDLNLSNSWEVGSVIVLDEVQLYFDSLDFKEFPKEVRSTFQLHRHFGINNIYINSQHPSRIVKQLRVLCCEFYDITNFIKIPFTPFAFFRYNIYYNSDDFGKSVAVKKADVSYKFSKRFLFINYKKLYKSYDTIYMNNLVSDKPIYDSNEFISKTMSKTEIDSTFDIDDREVQKKSNKAVKHQKQVISNIFSLEDEKKLDESVEDFKVDHGFSDSKIPGNNFIDWTELDSKPSGDVFSLINDIESNNNEKKEVSNSNFWD